MARLQALLWDVDGTLAETERDGHRVAFNIAFEAWGLPWHWDVAHYGRLLSITGGRERVLHDMTLRDDAPEAPEDREALARAIHSRKNEIYADLVRDGRIPLREGVLGLMQQCRARGVRMGIATTTSRSNVDALLRVHLGEHWTEWFPAIVCGEDVERKKPDPEVYVHALRALGIDATEAVAIEDSPNGVAAARAVDIPVIVTRSAYFADATIEGALAVGPALNERRGWSPALRMLAANDEPVGLDDIEDWCARSETAFPFT
jgi:HAD superfamily hydrolase (TIGR01509 family)